MPKYRMRSRTDQTAAIAPFCMITDFNAQLDAPGMILEVLRLMILFRTLSVLENPVLCRCYLLVSNTQVETR